MGATYIQQRQIADGAINDAKVAAGAAIASSKLADGANFLKKDGSVAMTGNLDLGTNRIVNVSTPSGSNDAANKSYVDTAISNLNSFFSFKGACRVKATGNVTIATPGTATFDGVTLSNGDRILLASQSSASGNGIYIFNGSGAAMTRSSDMDAWSEVPGAFVIILEGTANADTIWLCTSTQGGTLGTTAITFINIPTTGLTNANFIDKEIPSGSINGSNVTFTLANTPVSGSEHFYLNGVLQESGSGNDYTISTNTITVAVAPTTGEKVRVTYRK